jgi:hypothetical protein
MKLYHHGQIEGRKMRQPVLLSSTGEEPIDEELKMFYEKALAITLADAFRNGKWQLLEVLSAGDGSFSELVSYHWQKDDQLKLVVVNLGIGFSQGRIPIRSMDRNSSLYVLLDELNNRQYVRSRKEMADPGLHVMLEGFCAHVFDITPLS